MPTKKYSSRSKTKHTKKNTNQKPIIIHIEGVQGSGKSYICSKIVSSKCLCIDIDDMDLELKNYLDSLVGTPNEMPLNFDSLGKVWKDKLEEKIALEYNAGKKVIVIVGVKRIYMKNTSLVTPVILCGGSGTRLWPLSRTGFPKQFLCLSGGGV